MRFLKANNLFDGKNFLSADSVLVLDEQTILTDIISENAVDKNAVEFYEGIITPGFINTHCHLELSHLKHKIPQHTGLAKFAQHIISTRATYSKEEILEHISQANLEMWNNGIVAVGDISNTNDSFKEKTNSNVFYHTFIELIGLNPKHSLEIFEKGLALLTDLKKLNLHGSLAPHAPYSTSTELIKLIANYNAQNNTSFSIHNQESMEETKFFAGEKNEFENLYSFLNIDLSWFDAPKTSSLNAYLSTLSNRNSILVHNTFTTKQDLELTKLKPIFWCFCPGANRYIENTLPDFTLFSDYKSVVCFGTDSLASNQQLDLLVEANIILKSTTNYSLEDILRALTHNGADALGISSNFGSLKIGKNTGLNLISNKNAQLQFIKKLA